MDAHLATLALEQGALLVHRIATSRGFDELRTLMSLASSA